MSIAGYVAAIGLAFVAPWVSIALYATVAGMWLVPDRRIESRIES
jgi:biopolymer transport protein ExbB/TolQ